MKDPVAAFTSVAARHRRCFWLDGGGAREWSGRRSIIGWLDDDDVSLTYDAARGEVTRHASGRAERRRRRRLRRARAGAGRRPADGPVVRLLRLRRPAGPPRRDRLRSARRRLDAGPARPDVPSPRPRRGGAAPTRPRRGRLRAGRDRGLRAWSPEQARARCRSLPARNLRAGSGRGAARRLLPCLCRVQEHLHAGNSYEVNLTYRLARPASSIRRRRTCGCATSTPRRTPGSSSTTCRDTGPGCSARARSATRWSMRTG